MSALDLTTLPPVYAELARSKNMAADAALVEGISHMEPEYQAHALRVLVHRGHDSALAQVVALYSRSEPPLRALLIQNAELLAGGIRVCMKHALFDSRKSAIELIANSRHGKSAYLLSEALSQPCRRTAALSAEVLLKLAESATAESKPFASSSKQQQRGQLDYVSSAVAKALSSWSLHFRNEVILAAIQLAGPLEETIVRLAEDPRTHIARALNNAVAGSHDHRLIGYCLRALRCEPLRESALKSLARMSGPQAEAALARHGWLIADPEISRACSRLTKAPGFDREHFDFVARSPRQARSVIRVFQATGGKSAQKAMTLGDLALNAGPTLRRAAFWALIDNEHPKSTDMLQAIAVRGRGSYASLASLELRRRNGMRLAHEPGASDRAEGNNGSSDRNIDEVFEPFWAGYDDLEHSRRRSVARTVADGLPEFDHYLRSKWATKDVNQQIRALKIVEDVEHVTAFYDEIHDAAESSNPVLRSMAVRLLGSIADAKSVRLIRKALDDDDSRVQANAVESFAKCGQEDAATHLRKMVKANHNRVRANAIMALLQMRVRDGAEALIKMLQSPTSGHRTSALWVVEHLNLGMMVERITHLAENDPDTRVQKRAQRMAEKFKLNKTPQTVPTAVVVNPQKQEGPNRNTPKQGVTR